MGKLTVILEKVTHLVDEDMLGKTDAFVKFRLETDNWGKFGDDNHGRKCSTVKKDTINPVYHETFAWDDVPDLKNLTLWVEITDDDPLKNDKIGKCKIMIEDLSPGPDFVGCDRVVDNNIFAKDARIYLKIKWED